MEKGKIRFIVVLVTLLLLSGILFGVLYAEEGKRLARAERDRQTFLVEQQAIEQDRKQYFTEVAAKRAELRAGMDASKQQYEALLKNQSAAIAQNQTTRTETVTVPVQTSITTSTTVSKPKSTRSTKTS